MEEKIQEWKQRPPSQHSDRQKLKLRLHSKCVTWKHSEHPVPSTPEIISEGNSNPCSAHGRVWVILVIFCDTSWTTFYQKYRFENISERETSSQTITMNLTCLGFVPWLHGFEPVTTFLLHFTEAPPVELKRVDPWVDCCTEIRYLYMVAMLSELFGG